jgi:hypothetical protein
LYALRPEADNWAIAFSSEVDAGSREENASKQKLEPGADSIRTDKALAFSTSVLRPRAVILANSIPDQTDPAKIL